MNFLPIEIYIYKKNFLIKQTNFQIEIKQNKLISTFPVTGTCNACFSDNKWGLKSMEFQEKLLLKFIDLYNTLILEV